MTNPTIPASSNASVESVMAMTPLYDSAMQQFPKERYPLLLWQGLVKQIEEENANLQEANRVQLAAISTAALGYWKPEQGVLPEFDSVALRDVASLYAKYEALRAEVSRLATGRADTPDAEIVTLTLEDGKKAKVIRALDLKWIARVPNGTKLYAALPAAPGAAQGEVK